MQFSLIVDASFGKKGNLHKKKSHREKKKSKPTKFFLFPSIGTWCFCNSKVI